MDLLITEEDRLAPVAPNPIDTGPSPIEVAPALTSIRLELIDISSPFEVRKERAGLIGVG
ncbi:hypothetical protein [Sphaerisporangium aureirubrum]|uniref:ABC transporter ATP-binding protein n=1 Tax=Sphaerisporangium aureirubrum TaxID=1544736 RepID=A0ABW1NCP4_9ACTN